MPTQRSDALRSVQADVDDAGLTLCSGMGLRPNVAGPVAVVLILLWGFIGWAIVPIAQQTRLVRIAGPLAPIALSLNQSALYVGIGIGAALGSAVVAFGSAKALGLVGAACEVIALLWLVIPTQASRVSVLTASSLPSASPEWCAPYRRPR